LLATAGSLFLATACASILGIEDASPDPLLQGGAGQGGNGPVGYCDDYCSSIEENCQDDLQQYSARAVCEGVCAALPEGNIDNPVGNTIACRMKNATEAGQIGGQTECSAAGPGTDGICGDNCDSFCLLFQSLCSVQFEQEFAGSLNDCRELCNTLPDLFDDDGTTFSSSLTTQGNSVQCRLYHVSQAVLDAATHCKHASGDPPCASANSAGGGGGSGMGFY